MATNFIDPSYASQLDKPQSDVTEHSAVASVVYPRLVRTLTHADRACCCAARPSVMAIMPAVSGGPPDRAAALHASLPRLPQPPGRGEGDSSGQARPPADRRGPLVGAAGLLIVAAGLFQMSLATSGTGYTGTLAGMVMLGVGAGFVIPASTASVMGSVPLGHTGVGSATNGAALQIGGALGVAIIGSLLNTRYLDKVTAAVAPYHVPHEILTTITGSLGGALAVAARAGGVLGAELAAVARAAFVNGMDLGLAVGAAVAVAGALLAFAWLPSRPGGSPDDSPETGK